MNPTRDTFSIGNIHGSVVGGQGGRYENIGTKDNIVPIIINVK